MKKTLYILIVALTTVFSFTSCSDWLDVTPNTDVPAKELFTTLIPVALILSVGIGFFGSFFTTRKHLRV